MRKGVGLLIFGLIMAVAVSPSYAVSFGFNNISANSALNAAIGESQLSVDVSLYEFDPEFVVFSFINSGPEASVITQIYFDDLEPPNSILEYFFVDIKGGVLFTRQPAIPHELPDANLASPPFVTTAGLSVGAENPAPLYGVNSGESVELLFSLLNNKGLTDVLAAMTTGDLRAGIHVQAFANGGSESFVTGPGNPVPEPATMLLFGVGLVGLAGFCRKRIL